MLAIISLRPFQHVLLHLSGYSLDQRPRSLISKTWLRLCLLTSTQERLLALLLAVQFRVWDYVLALCVNLTSLAE